MLYLELKGSYKRNTHFIDVEKYKNDLIDIDQLG